jgi:Flp pilus assembly protein TadD
MMHSSDQLAHIMYIKIPRDLAAKAVGLPLDPEILLPVECANEPLPQEISRLSWEAIVAGLLRVLIYDPENPQAGYFRALVKALRPDIKREFTAAGIAKSKNGQFPIAEELLQAVCALYPECGRSALNLALCLEQTWEKTARDTVDQSATDTLSEQADRVHVAYLSALDCADHPAETHRAFGYFLLAQSSWTKAREQFLAYLERETDPEKTRPVTTLLEQLAASTDLETLFQAAFDDMQMNREQEALEKTALILSYHPDFWNAWFLHGWALRRLGRMREAIQAFQRVLSLSAPKTDVLNELAVCHMQLGELEQSRSCLEQAVAMDPENPKFLSNLGVLYLKCDDPAMARDWFAQALALDPEDDIARHYLSALEP